MDGQPPQLPQGLNNLKIYLHFIYDSANLALTASSHSQSQSSPGRLEARSEACSALSLKPKQNYLISLTGGRAFFPPQPYVVFLTHLRREGFEALKEMFVKATGSLKN